MKGWSLGRACSLPSWGSGACPQKKNQFCAKNYAILNKFWYFFPILQHKVGGLSPSPKSGGPIPCPPPRSDAYGSHPLWTTARKHFRQQHSRQFGCIEIGSEKFRATRNPFPTVCHATRTTTWQLYVSSRHRLLHTSASAGPSVPHSGPSSRPILASSCNSFTQHSADSLLCPRP